MPSLVGVSTKKRFETDDLTQEAIGEDIQTKKIIVIILAFEETMGFTAW